MGKKEKERTITAITETGTQRERGEIVAGQV
jgi:hypothetical protein